jgi:hypothetical protein
MNKAFEDEQLWRKIWNEALNKIVANGGLKDEKVVFYN